MPVPFETIKNGQIRKLICSHPSIRTFEVLEINIKNEFLTTTKIKILSSENANLIGDINNWFLQDWLEYSSVIITQNIHQEYADSF